MTKYNCTLKKDYDWKYMENESEQYILNKLTKNLTALIIQSNHEIEENFKDYFEELFSEAKFLDKYNLIQEYLKANKPDYIFLDLETINIEPFGLIEEIRSKFPRQVIIAISSSQDPDMFIQCIDHNLTSFLQKPLNLTMIKDKIIHCLEHLVLNDPTVIYKTKLSSLYDTPYEAIKYLIEHENFQIDLINHYKGVPIIRHAAILDINNDIVRVKIQDIQKYILEYSHHSIINSRNLSYDIYAYLVDVDKENDIAIFSNLTFIKSYVHHRQYVRIAPDNFFNITLISDEKKYKANVLNLSIKYALIALPKVFSNLNINSEIQLVLSFKLNHLFERKEFQSYAIQTKAIIKRVYNEDNELKALFYFELESKESRLLKDYIHARSLTLIKEFKRNNIPLA